MGHRNHLVIIHVHLVTGSNSTIHGNYKTTRIPRNCCPNDHRSASMFHSWNQTFRIIGFLGRSPKRNLPWCCEQREGRLIVPYYVFPAISRPGFMTMTPCFSPFSAVLRNHRFRNCNSTVGVGFVKLSSECFCGNGVYKMNIEFCCHLRCSNSIIF